jgi:DNA-binding XRE family transcriptional regulator
MGISGFMNDSEMKISARVKSIRGEVNLTQRQLAGRLGVSCQTVNRWENGHAEPNRQSWIKLLRLPVKHPSMDDHDMLVAIQGLLSRVEWSSDTAAAIADLLNENGWPIAGIES